LHFTRLVHVHNKKYAMHASLITEKLIVEDINIIIC